MLEEVLVSEASGFEPSATSFVALMVATVMAKMQQPGMCTILEFLIVDLDGRQLLLQLLHPHVVRVATSGFPHMSFGGT